MSRFSIISGNWQLLRELGYRGNIKYIDIRHSQDLQVVMQSFHHAMVLSLVRTVGLTDWHAPCSDSFTSHISEEAKAMERRLRKKRSERINLTKFTPIVFSTVLPPS